MTETARQDTKQDALPDTVADVAIIGAGVAGFAAATFCLDRGWRAAQIGNTGALAYTTGYLDLLGYEGGKPVDDVWPALDRLRKNEPGHPLAIIERSDIQAAVARFIEALGELGIGYTEPGEKNLRALLPAGITKPTLSIPKTMQAGVAARADNKRTIIVDFPGLAGFSAKEIVANFSGYWPELSAKSVGFPGMDSGAEVFPEVLARTLEVPAHRRELAERLLPIIGDAECVGLPAILGVHAPDKVHIDMEKRLGVPLFEIPTMPPAVAGLRLRELFEQALPARGVTLVAQRKVERLEGHDDGYNLHFHDNFGPVTLSARTVILATGRFLAGGLKAERNRVIESLLDLPVAQPDSREDWFSDAYLDPCGHPINRSGISVDADFRPCGADGAMISDRLFAAGSILSGQDWVRQRCGAGIAIATAWRAVQGVAAVISQNTGK